MFYKSLKPFLAKSGLISQFNNLAETKKPKQVFGLTDSAKSLLLAHIFFITKKPILYITQNDVIARNTCDDLEILIGKDNVHFLPEYELLPYEEFSPRLSCQIERSNTLSKAVLGESRRLYNQRDESGIFIVSIKEFLRNINHHENYKTNIISLSKEEEYVPLEKSSLTGYDLEKLVSDLIACGYNYTSQVSQIGEISKRGGILDIFSPQYENPFRLEFFGDEIVSIREFSAKSQCSTKDDYNKIIVQPMREISLNNLSSYLQNEFIKKIAEKGFYDGIEQDFAKLFDRTATLSEYFNSENTFLVFDEFQNFANIEKNLFEEIDTNYEEKINKFEKNLVPKPSELFSEFNNLNLKDFSISYFNSSNYNLAELSLHIPFESQIHPVRFSCPVRCPPSDGMLSNGVNFNSNFELLESKIDLLLQNGFTVFIQSDNKNQSQRMQEILSEYQDKVRFEIGVFQNGFIFDDARLAIFTDHEIFNRYKQKRRRVRFSPAEALKDYESLQNGDYVVHIDYGIGIYQGLEKIKVKESEMDCVAISYANDDKIFVPTEQLNLISKFIAQEAVVPEIHRIGERRWNGLKKKIRKDIEEIAKDLVYLYAQRKLAKGFAFSPDSEWQKNLEASFIYEDTSDQIKATEEIKNDMESAIPMERLICGDVGFGKTEVAIRAAFKSVMDSKQVAFLCPTTILAEQHYITFLERLKDYPIRVEMLSRFVTQKNQKRIIDGLQFGEIDIAIGTHRLLSKDVKFKNLGLVIIDEEQRFGVKQKEKLKALKADTDILFLSATPIPRTLNMALSRVKDMTIMNIPPENRLPILTAITPYNDDIIELAIKREIDRQGQVFFLHNRVETIFAMKQRLCNQMPDISFEVAHAQMPERTLEKVMLDFYHYKFDVLICTTIIESGIDIPNVNTIIINRADKFGLAQLYQLRGRVGRSDHQAYSYLIVPDKISGTARERIRTIEQHEALGSGLSIAMHDLEIRGAGNILGAKQHGLMNTIGISFYNQILKKAIERIRKGHQRDIFEIDRKTAKIQCEIPYFFPEKYISDGTIRMDFYRRLNNLKKGGDFNKLQSEMTDRFGKLPQSARNVFKYYLVNFYAEKNKIKSVYIGKRKIIIEPFQSIISKKKIEQIVKSTALEVCFKQTKGLNISVNIPHNKIDRIKGNFDICIKILKILNK
ncbi:MAG: transcription-repair coupling factor [Candidatus Cloacimonetes bacterium]|nr:transcription-repair coupling factor [Candidatus Cloacimonadota bacterium]